MYINLHIVYNNSANIPMSECHNHNINSNYMPCENIFLFISLDGQMRIERPAQ